MNHGLTASKPIQVIFNYIPTRTTKIWKDDTKEDGMEYGIKNHITIKKQG